MTSLLWEMPFSLFGVVWINLCSVWDILKVYGFWVAKNWKRPSMTGRNLCLFLRFGKVGMML